MSRAYYNEHDPKAAAWLRELIREGLIPKGEVDERSIIDVRPGDIRGYVQCHFFAGIGGWPYALRLAGWPDDRPVWTGSCPCQPFSSAGKRKGTADERHLWPEFYRLIRECRPPVVLGEQVAGAAGRAWLDLVFADLESSAYACGAADLPACSLGAPHKRSRLFWGAFQLEDANRLQPKQFAWQGPRPNGAESAEAHGQFAGRSESCCLGHATGARHNRAQQDTEADSRDEARLRVSGEASGPRGVADATSSGSGTGLCDHRKGGQRRAIATDHGCACGVVHPSRGRRGVELDAAQPGRCGHADGSDATGDLADASGSGLEERHSERRDATGDERAPAERGGAVSKLADADGRLAGDGELQRGGQFGLQPQGGLAESISNPDRLSTSAKGPLPSDQGTSAADSGFDADRDGLDRLHQPAWTDPQWLFCRDGKWRPIEPGTQPLAYGLPARTGRLRGYGNAIVPQVAAEFVGAWLEVTGE